MQFKFWLTFFILFTVVGCKVLEKKHPRNYIVDKENFSVSGRDSACYDLPIFKEKAAHHLGRILETKNPIHYHPIHYHPSVYEVEDSIELIVSGCCDKRWALDHLEKAIKDSFNYVVYDTVVFAPRFEIVITDTIKYQSLTAESLMQQLIDQTGKPSAGLINFIEQSNCCSSISGSTGSTDTLTNRRMSWSMAKGHAPLYLFLEINGNLGYHKRAQKEYSYFNETKYPDLSEEISYIINSNHLDLYGKESFDAYILEHFGIEVVLSEPEATDFNVVSRAKRKK